MNLTTCSNHSIPYRTVDESMKTTIQQRKYRPLCILEAGIELFLLDGSGDRSNDLVFQVDLEMAVPRKVCFVDMVSRSHLLRLANVREAFILLYFNEKKLRK